MMKQYLAVALCVALSQPLAASNDDPSYEEALAQLEEQFAAADVNGDGRLTRQEARDAGMNRLARGFGRVDTEDRGYVTLEQLKRRLRDRYD